MDDKPPNRVSEDFPIQKVVAKLYSRAPRRQDDEKLKNLNIPISTLVLESEKKSRSATSSRRNSDDGARASKEFFRENGTSSEPPTASVGDHAWSNLHSSNSTTRTELSLSDGAVDDQKRGIRAVYELRPTTSLREKFKETNILTLASQYIYENLIYDKRHIESFQKRSDFHNINTRHKNDLAAHKTRLSKVNKTFKGDRQHIKGPETAVPISPLGARSHWKSAESLAPEAAFGTSLSDIMESPGHKICLRDDLKCLDESDSEGAKPRPGWRLIRNVTSATVAFSPKSGKGNSAPTALPGTPLPSFQSKSDSKNSVYGNKDDRKPSLPSYPNEKDEINMGETTPEGLDPDSLMFRDGRRRIDMVLAYEEEDYGVMTEAEARRRDYRRTFQENLIKEGLELELENKCLSFDEKTWFLKIHIPWKTEMRLAEVTGMKLPTKRFITISVRAWSDEKQGERDKKWHSKCRRLWKRLYEYEHSRIDPDPSFYAATDQRGVRREEQFLVKDRHTQFSPAQRSLLVMQILLRAKYDNNETKMGIRRLLNDSTYLACFPLHEGRYDADGPNGAMTDRRLLYLEWARPSKWYKKQPLWMVRRYFGEKIGLYFCWLGFYTKMLYAPAVVGTLCFLYGLASMDSSDNIPRYRPGLRGGLIADV
ncbi:Anoctamin-6 [Eumeta japonica]|uniref:Anoctamin n=1 Tax=Eumeta variegata TaxID=151549 RepID=A0A4C1Z5B7_EUMVA|nr:Anoctamin-6 [Eumeta japonica]